MRHSLNEYLQAVTNIVAELGGRKEHLDKIHSIFDDISIEVGYIDQRRDEAETNLRVLLASLEAESKSQTDPSYEQK
jgi:hypothetical protein